MISNKLYKISKLIIAGNVNQLSNIFQEEWFENKNKLNYYELEEQEKEALKQYIKNRKEEVEKEISSKVKNIQYKSWIYDILIKKDQFFEDIDKMIEEIKNLEYLKKNKNVLNEKIETKLENKDFDIKNYKTFGDLHTFTSEYLKLFKKRSLKTNNLKPNFEKVFSGQKYDVYRITKDDKELFQNLYGKDGYNTAWCVANKKNNYFDEYVESNLDCLYLFTLKNEKPYALLSFRAYQFKDIHDNSLKDFSDDILAFLGNFVEENQDFYYDLLPYEIKVLQFKNPDLSTSELFIKMEKNSKINLDGTIDVDGDVSSFLLLNFIENGKIIIKFNKVKGDFNCNFCKLTGLVGSPKIVNGSYSCLSNNLTSLDGCPEIVNKDFCCSYNKLTNLKGCPKTVNGDFDCSFNKLKSLDGCPKIILGDFICTNNELVNLMECPEVINKNFNCSNNQLTSLIGCPKIIHGSFTCVANKLNTLGDFPKLIGRHFNCIENQLISLSEIPEDFPKAKIFCDWNKLSIKELLKTIGN